VTRNSPPYRAIRLLEVATVKPMVDQILTHISNTPHELIAYAQAQGLLVEAYSPVAHGELLKNGQAIAIAERYGVSVAQLSLRYCLELGLLPLPKTVTPAHMRSNAELDFSISDDDMALLKTIDRIVDYGSASSLRVFGGKPGARLGTGMGTDTGRPIPPPQPSLGCAYDARHGSGWSGFRRFAEGRKVLHAVGADR